MTEGRERDIEIIVNTLLQVSDFVAELLESHVIARIWERDGFSISNKDKYLGRKISEVNNSDIFTRIDGLVAESFKTSKNGYIEYGISKEHNTAHYSIRTLPIHPDKDFLFVVVKNISKKEGVEHVEDKWKLALDAAGDGMWDVNAQTGRIYFSDKWHEIFGYSPDEISTVSEWASKIHPDDRGNSRKLRDDYLSGKTPSYTTEIRYLYKDGRYRWILSRAVTVSHTADGKPLRFIGTHTDINERKVAEERYFTTAQLLLKLINNLQSGIVVSDEHRKVIFANQVYCDMFKVSGGSDMLLGMDLGEGIEKRKQLYKDPELFVKRSDEVFNKREIVLNEEWELKDDRVISRDYIPLLSGDDTNVKGCIWKFTDITNQRNVEKRIEEQRFFYEQILNSIPRDIVVFDKDHRYLFVNPVAIQDEAIRKWLIGKTDEEYCRIRNRPQSIIERRKDIFKTALHEREQIQWEEKLQNASGEMEYHLRNMFPVFKDDGSLLMMIGYAQNITERIQAQEALKTSRDTFASAFDYSGIGMALIGVNGKWLDVNKVICDLTGFSKYELLEHSYHDITYKDDDEIDRPFINQLLKREITTYTIEKRYVSKMKKIVLVSLTVSVVWNSDDTPKFFIAQVIDITKKKELENQIYRKNAELEATKTNLINKIKQLEELSHIIAHNLRGPAGNIKMLAGALLAAHKKDASAEDKSNSELFTLDEAVELINESSETLMNSLSTLMEITEIKLNKEIPFNDCDVKTLVNDVTTHLYSTIYEKHAVIRLNLAVPVVSYPKAYLENILYNFISNALKYSKQDAPPDITISTRVNNGKVQIGVQDNGLGIDIKRYGDRVFKLNETFHQGYDSKGVGLYITKTQVESLGGTIEVKSSVNAGSEFIVTL